MVIPVFIETGSWILSIFFLEGSRQREAERQEMEKDQKNAFCFFFKKK